MEREIFLLLSLIVAVCGVIVGGVFGILGWLFGSSDLWKLGLLFFCPGITLVLWCRYCEALFSVSIRLTDDQYLAVVDRIFELVGKVYGIDDCIQGGIKDLFGLSKSKESKLAEEASVNCSQAALHIIRAAFPEFMADRVADAVTPEALRQEVIREWGS